MKKIVITSLLMIFAIFVSFGQAKTKTFSFNGISFEHDKGCKIYNFGGSLSAYFKGNTIVIMKLADDSPVEYFEMYLKGLYETQEAKLGSTYSYISEITSRTINGIETKSFDVKYSSGKYERHLVFIEKGSLFQIIIKSSSGKTIDSDFATILNSFHFESM